LCLEDAGPETVAERCECAFLCLPHAASAESAKALLARGVRVIDFSADYRLDDGHPDKAWIDPVPHHHDPDGRDLLSAPAQKPDDPLRRLLRLLLLPTIC